MNIDYGNYRYIPKIKSVSDTRVKASLTREVLDSEADSEEFVAYELDKAHLKGNAEEKLNGARIVARQLFGFALARMFDGESDWDTGIGECFREALEETAKKFSKKKLT